MGWEGRWPPFLSSSDLLLLTLYDRTAPWETYFIIQLRCSVGSPKPRVLLLLLLSAGSLSPLHTKCVSSRVLDVQKKALVPTPLQTACGCMGRNACRRENRHYPSCAAIASDYVKPMMKWVFSRTVAVTRLNWLPRAFLEGRCSN